MPIPIGDNHRALSIAARLAEAGFRAHLGNHPHAALADLADDLEVPDGLPYEGHVFLPARLVLDVFFAT